MLKFEENLASRVSGALQPMLGVQVTVTAKNGLLATLYADDESTVLANPVTTDANGYFGFKAANGEYTLTLAGAQIETATRNIELYDADDDPPLTLAQAAVPTAASRLGFQCPEIGAVPRTVENKLDELRSVMDFGALGDGATDDHDSLVSAPTETVPAGIYKVEANIDDSQKTFVLKDGAVFTGAGHVLADVQRPTMIYPGKRKVIADVWKKGNSAQAIRIAAVGDSLTYGLQSGGPRPSTTPNVNDRRASTTWPEELRAAMAHFYGGNVTVDNFGYPGDRTIEAVTRWAGTNWSQYDAVFFMLGTNDRQNLSVEQFRRYYRYLIERCITAGCVVVLMSPPISENMGHSSFIRAYGDVARQLAVEYALPYVDARDQLQSIRGSIWTDGLHLTTAAYAELGWHLSTLLLCQGGDALQHVSPGVELFGGDALTFIRDTSQQVTESGVRYGTAIQVKPGGSILLPLYVDAPCVPVVTTLNKISGTDQPLTYYYGGTAAATVALPNSTAQAMSSRRGYTLPVLTRGYRLIMLRNDGAADAFFEGISFRAPGRQVQTSGGLWRPVELKAHRPHFSGAGWWYARGSERFPYIRTLSAQMTLAASGQCGPAIFADERQDLDYGTPNQVMFLRAGTGLRVKKIVAGVITDIVYFATFDGNATPVFVSGAAFTGQIDVLISASRYDIYVDRQLVGLVNTPPFTGGYMAIVNDGPATIVAHSIMIAEGP